MDILREIEANILPSTKISQCGAPSASVAMSEGEHLEAHVFTTNGEDFETLFLADSNAKSITSIGVARLVDQGLLNYNDKIIDHMDAETFLHYPKSGELVQYVTIQMLLTYTSGMVKKDTCDHAHMREFTGHACWHFSHFPGSKWYYDDAFGLLQMAMDKVTAQPFQNVMKDYVTEPLGMTRTTWGHLPGNEINLAKPHFRGVEVPLPSTYHQAESSTHAM